MSEVKHSFATGITWYNELGSTMVIESIDQNTGVFSGTYESQVGQAKYTYVMTGRFDTAGRTIGWAVNWQNDCCNAHSVTTWSGQLQFNSIGEPVILTTWLLTHQTAPDDNWSSTQVGFDTFTLAQPSEETKAKAMLRNRSHPKEA